MTTFTSQALIWRTDVYVLTDLGAWFDQLHAALNQDPAVFESPDLPQNLPRIFEQLNAAIAASQAGQPTTISQEECDLLVALAVAHACRQAGQRPFVWRDLSIPTPILLQEITPLYGLRFPPSFFAGVMATRPFEPITDLFRRTTMTPLDNLSYLAGLLSGDKCGGLLFYGQPLPL